MSMGWLKKYKKWATELDEKFQALKKRSAFDSNTGEWVEINKEEAIEAEMIEISDPHEEFLSEEEKNSWEEKFYSKEKEFYADLKNQFYELDDNQVLFAGCSNRARMLQFFTLQALIKQNMGKLFIYVELIVCVGILFAALDLYYKKKLTLTQLSFVGLGCVASSVLYMNRDSILLFIFKRGLNCFFVPASFASKFGKNYEIVRLLIEPAKTPYIYPQQISNTQPTLFLLQEKAKVWVPTKFVQFGKCQLQRDLLKKWASSGKLTPLKLFIASTFEFASAEVLV